jgi:hypothetical protein
MIYCLLVVSVMPRCSSVAAVLDAPTYGAALAQLAWAFADTLAAILLETYLSLGMLVLLVLICLGFCKGGGVGCQPSQPQQQPKQQPKQQAKQPAGAAAAAAAANGQQPGGGSSVPVRHAPPPMLKARQGGLGMRLLFTGVHCLLHVTAAISLMLLLELGVEMCVR